jgi:HD-GYP domain-containing protein (c-di-GMP phosphodiesterase class II)
MTQRTPEPDAQATLGPGSWELPGAELWTFNSHGSAQLLTCGSHAPHPARFLCPESDLVALVTMARSEQRPMARAIESSVAALAVPAGDQSSATVQLRLLDSAPELLTLLEQLSAENRRLRRSLADAETQMRQREEQLQSYATHVTRELEEAAWLRDLTGKLELSASGNNVEGVTDFVLPALCRILKAGTVAFIRELPAPGLDEPLPVIWQTGPAPYGRSALLAVLEQLIPQAACGPLTRRFGSPWVAHPGAPGIESCMLTAVSTQHVRVGWLLALNIGSIPGEPTLRSSGDVRRPVMLREGQSFEDSLLQSASIILAAHSHNCDLFREKEVLLKGVIRSMINAIDAKDSYTCGHSDRVAELARMIAMEMDLTEEVCEQIHMTGLLHDVGKIGVPDHVLKKPGRLTVDEFEQIKQHPVIGYEILKHLSNLKYVLPGVLHHHEAFDGSGYPHGLRGDQIPLSARILAVADAYDAMTSNRPYRRGMPSERAEQILRDGAGAQWDVDCVNAFFRRLPDARRMPTVRSGTIVLLSPEAV